MSFRLENSHLKMCLLLLVSTYANFVFSGNNGCDSADAFRAELGNQVCMTGNTTDAKFGLYEASNEGCLGSPFETFWFSIPTHANNRFLDLDIQSSELSVPTVSIYEGSCGSLRFIDCNVAYDGRLVMKGVLIEPGATYFVAVSSRDGSAGEFQLCYDLEEDSNVCNTNSELRIISTSNGSPAYGPYKQGEEVNFCYTIDGFQNVGCNYLHAIIPLFGEGWDLTSYELSGVPSNITTPLETQGNTIFTNSNPSCEGDPAGTWTWLYNNELSYNLNSENTLNLTTADAVPPGWVFINSFNPDTDACFNFTEACCVNPTDDPNLGYGDDDFPLCSNGMTQKWEVCFTLTAANNPISGESSCELGLKTFSDGETGSFTDKECKRDRVSYINAAVEVCLPPSITADNTQAVVCAGDSVRLELISDQPDVQYYWINNTTGETVKGTTESAFTGVWEEAGEYTFSIFATNGCDSDPLLLEIEVTQDVAFSVEQTPAIACTDDFVTLRIIGTDNDIADRLNYAWNSGMPDSNDSIRVSARDSMATVDVILGSCINTEAYNFNLYPHHELTLSAPDQACQGEEVNFNALSTSTSWRLTLQSNGEVVNVNSDEASYNSLVELSQMMDFEIISAFDANGCEMAVTGMWRTALYDPIDLDAGSDIALSCDQEEVDVFADISPNIQDYNATWTDVTTGEIVSSVLNFTISEIGEYQLTVVNIQMGCQETDTLSVTRVEREINLEIESSEITVEVGQEIQLDILTDLDESDIAAVEWIHDGSLACDDCLSTTAIPTNDITYLVMITDNLGCVAETSITIEVEDAAADLADDQLYIPNIFSPDMSDENAVFRIFGNDNIEIINSFRVYDRWGGTVRELSNYNPDDNTGLWDGIVDGDLVSSGVYLYVLDLSMKDGLSLKRTGSITVFR